DAPLHDELNINNVLVPGEDMTFLRNLADIARRAAETDRDLIGLRDLGANDGSNRCGEPVIDAGLRRLDISAEQQFDALLVRLNDITAAEAPKSHDDGRQKPQRAEVAETARHHPAQAILTA